MSTTPRPHRPHKKPSMPVAQPIDTWRNETADDGFRIDSQPAAQPRPRRQSATSPAQAPARKGFLRRIANIAVVAANALVAIGLVSATYSARINPASHPLASFWSMTFSFWLWIAITVFAADLWRWRRTAWIPGLAMLGCAGAIAAYMPLNMPRWGLNAQEKERAFTLMTYNVYAFLDHQKKSSELPFNRQLAYILEENPDVVCLQEALYLSPERGNNIRQYQIDSMRISYPYVMTQGRDFAILSKFPVEPINLDFPASQFQSGDIAAWRLKIHGRVVNIFSVHLRSFSLTNADKNAYRDIVKLENPSRSELHDAKESIVPKIARAGAERALQIEYLNKYLKKYGGKYAIVVGDFNDPVNSYAVSNVCAQSHMRQAYADAGFWPLPTYNASSLYFRIDHVLYRGPMQAYSISRGSLKASDHYPLTTTFLLDKE